MAASVRAMQSFPAVSLPSAAGGAPVEVALIAQLGIGAGDRLISDAAARQASHAEFVDALDEPSTRLGAMHLEHGDASSLYSFVVGPRGHPFHRHATPRTFTAISGSSGADLRFSTVGAEDLIHDAAAFMDALRTVTIPPDCLFSVRFGGGTWHQFLARKSPHPALFALSCHTNELGGSLDAEQRDKVLANAATIPALTDVLPQAVQALVDGTDSSSVPRVDLSLHAPPASVASAVCAWIRGIVGHLRSRLPNRSRGFLGRPESKRTVTTCRAQPEGSLLNSALPAAGSHDDCVSVTLSEREVGRASAGELLARVLEGFIENRPVGVSRLMALRNFMVKPMRLRTSPMGCPVSSLLSTDRSCLYAGRFPVLAQHTSDRSAQVLLGADDRHLIFRSCVSVRLNSDGSAEVSLGTQVKTRNSFGRLYMTAIDVTHRRYVAPCLLRMAIDHAMAGNPCTGASGGASRSPLAG
jgi:hypothetical protein